MTRHVGLALTLAVMTVGLTACIEDDSAPNRRGIERPLLGAGQQERDRAEKRALEAPGRELPTGGGREFPGQSRIDNGTDRVLTLADGVAPERRPNLVEDNKPAMLPGQAIAVPGTGMVIESDWGSVQAMPVYPHRPWPDQRVNYLSSGIKNNPTYYRDLVVSQVAPNDVVGAVGTRGGVGTGALDNGLLGPKTPQNTATSGVGSGTATGGPGSYGLASDNPAAVGADLVEIPWFFGETLALPVLMVLDPPLAQKTSAPGHQLASPVYLGQLPAAGGTVPTLTPGQIKWEYPFTTTQPATPSPLPIP